jgi:hypothetical protein
MLSNPVRPQFEDIIDEAWGDQVADMVVRRYVDTAARDADLAGFDPTTLAGQVVGIVPAVPGVPFLQIHNGSGWVGLASGVPAPLLPGALFQSFTDCTGDVWIAKGDVAGGAWRRARDVLYCTSSRSGAFSVSTTATNLGFEATLNDEYAIRATASPYQIFTMPIAGLYRLRAQISVNTTAGGQSLTCGVKIGAAVLTNMQNQGGGNGRLDVAAEFLSPLNAGDQVAFVVSSNPALTGNASAMGVSPTWASVEYVGTAGRTATLRDLLMLADRAQQLPDAPSTEPLPTKGNER